MHGLWPQYERGWPRACVANQPRDVAQPIVASMLDLMPSPQLIQNQWDRHGLCTGLAPPAYFTLTRDFRRRVVIPQVFVAPQAPLRLTAAEVEAAFAKANPGLSGAKISVQCARNRLREVRICFTKAGQFRACGADVRDDCEGRVTMPPVRLAAR